MDSVILLMKKVISISLTLLMLIALLHFSVATHYCMEKIATSKISLSGELATCGMENDEDELPQTGLNFTTHCCDNVIVFCGISGNYFPSFFQVPETYNDDFQVLGLPSSKTFFPVASFLSINTSVNPPGVSTVNNVDLTSICVFRI
jgi:hypothetical protein